MNNDFRGVSPQIDLGSVIASSVLQSERHRRSKIIGKFQDGHKRLPERTKRSRDRRQFALQITLLGQGKHSLNSGIIKRKSTGEKQTTVLFFVHTRRPAPRRSSLPQNVERGLHLSPDDTGVRTWL